MAKTGSPVGPTALASEFLSPERKIVSILFADFAGFTEYLRKHDPEVVHDWLKTTWAEVDAIIAAYGGNVGKHIGDAVMALFGEKEAREDAPAQAVRAAVAIQAYLAHLRAKAPQPHLQMRIGVHSGVVVLEPHALGGASRATGAAISQARRLEAAAPPGRVLISHDVFRSVYGLFDLEPLKLSKATAGSEDSQAYLVGRAKARGVARQLRNIEGVSTEMVGRRQELKILQESLQRVLKTGRAEVVTIMGEAGIGKSRLLQEFQRWAELLPARFWFFMGQATADMPSMPFALLRDVFASRFEIRDSDPAHLAREKLESGVLSLLSRCAASGAWPRQEPRQVAHFIGQLLGLDFSASPYLRQLLLDPAQLRHRGMHALRRFFNALAQGAGVSSGAPFVRGLLLVVEDIHWSDQASLDVLEDLAHGCADVPMLLLCLARPALLEQRPAWIQGLPAARRVKLDCLSLEESRSLVNTILRRAQKVPAALRDLVTDLAEGNPFYIEEILKMLIDQKVITPGPDRWAIETGRLSSARVPQSLTEVLQARLNGLAPDERAVIQRAAVVGRVFWDRALEALVAPANGSASLAADTSAKENLLRVLQGLMLKELILPRGASAFADAKEYIFKHELLRNAAYETLLKKVRRELHGLAAGWLIQQSGERSAEFAAQVAAHYEKAGREVEAADWYGRAGWQARGGHEPAMAIDYFQKAVNLLPRAGAQVELRRLEWLCNLMESLCEQARFKEARQLCLVIRRRAAQAGNLVPQARAWNGLAFLNERRAANAASVSAACQAYNIAKRAGPLGLPQQIRALQLKGWAYYRMANWPAVLKLSSQTQGLCHRVKDRHGLAVSLKLQGVVHLQRGDSRRADRCFEQGLRLCKEIGDRRNAAAMLSNLGESARLRGDFAGAIGFYEQALALVRRIGNRSSELIYLSNLHGARIGLGQFATAEAGLRQVISLAATRTSSMLSETFSFLAKACLGQGKLPEAQDAARRGIGLAREAGMELEAAIGWRVMGEVQAAWEKKGKTPQTRPASCFSRSLLLFKRMHAEAEQARTLRASALYERQRGRMAAAQRQLNQAARIFSNLRMRHEVEVTAALVGDSRRRSF